MTLGDSILTPRRWLITGEALRSLHAAAKAFLDPSLAAQPPPPESALLSIEDGIVRIRCFPVSVCGLIARSIRGLVGAGAIPRERRERREV